MYRLMVRIEKHDGQRWVPASPKYASKPNEDRMAVDAALRVTAHVKNLKRVR